ncbi:MAG: hypothetical protein K8S00_12135 [Bacteroidales bacterium]|nr:hypothetical protein [Bacteroidales bacterium]
MEQNTLEFILSISGIITVLLLAVIGFFLRQFIKSVNSLREVIIEIRIMVNSQKFDLTNFKRTCEDRHTYLSTNIRTINDQISKHQDSITVLKERTK